MSSIGIVVPAYCPDSQRLIDYIDDIQRGISPDRIHVELDAPSSSEIVHNISETGATVNVSEERRGKGAAITHGFEVLETDVMMFLDADGATTVESASDVLEPVVDRIADLSTGSRRHPEADVKAHQTVLRRRLGDSFAFLARSTLPIKLFDYQCGAKAITTSAWRDIRTHLYEDGFAWDLEMLAVSKILGLEVAEVPIKWEDMPGSTVDPVDTAIDMLRALIAIRHRSRSIQGHPIHAALPQSRSRPLLGDD